MMVRLLPLHLDLVVGCSVCSPLSLGIWETIVVGVKRFFGFKIPPVWDGDFDFGQPLPTLDEDKKELRARVSELQAMSAVQFFEQLVCHPLHLGHHITVGFRCC